jgi:glycosyltransferase involved in cell wall biosynthesis
VKHAVAIYAPYSARLYERSPAVTGGAERQMTMLAAGLARSGLSVAHVVLPVADAAPRPEGALTLVERAPFADGRGPAGRGVEAARLFAALDAADARTYVFRSGLSALGLAAAFCRARRRRLVFSSANNLDFTFEFFQGHRAKLELYKFGVRRSQAVVVQSRDQTRLAREAFPRLRRVVEIPSFAEPAASAAAAPEAFLWSGRLDRFKQPMRFLQLAESLPEARFWMVPKFLHEGPPLEREVKRRAARLQNLDILEPRPHAEAMKLVERSVAVVNTGAAEGMPNFFLEAWARGIPVLSFEFDPDGRIRRQGLGVAAAGSEERFAAGARRLWERRLDRGSLSRHLRAYVESTHGPDAVIAHWVKLIEEVSNG